MDFLHSAIDTYYVDEETCNYEIVLHQKTGKKNHRENEVI